MPDSEGRLESRMESKIFQNLILEGRRRRFHAKAGQATATTTTCGMVKMLWEETAEDPQRL